MTDNNQKIFFELQKVTKRLAGQRVIDRMDLQIFASCNTVIIGPSGCGKSVLLKHLIGLMKPDRGCVLFDGQRTDNLNEVKLLPMRKRCGFLFQGGALFDSETVAGNVSFPLLQHTDYSPQKICEIVAEKLEMVGMAGSENRMPAELSGGQQKRIALARAIALSPEIVFYDEPTTGLDPIRAESINDLILKLQHELKISSIIVTHDMNSAYRIADRIIMLGKGRIIADGTPNEIRSSKDEQVLRFIQGRAEKK